MLNIVFSFEQGNLGPVMESFGFDSHSYIFSGETSEAILTGFLEEVFRNYRQSRTKVKLMASRCGESRFFRVREILYFEAVGKRKRIHTTEGSPFEFYGEMYHIAEITGRLGFVRIHNAFIISLEHIRAVNSRHILLDNGDLLNIGKRYREDVKNALKHMHVHRL